MTASYWTYKFSVRTITDLQVCFPPSKTVSISFLCSTGNGNLSLTLIVTPFIHSHDHPPPRRRCAPLQCSCLKTPMGGGAWQAAVHGVCKRRTRLSDFTFTFHFHDWRRKWQPTPVCLPRESQGWGSLVGCRLWGHTESDMTEAA